MRKITWTPSAPSLTQLRMPSACSKRLMSGGQAEQIEPIGAGGIREPYRYWRKVQP